MPILAGVSAGKSLDSTRGVCPSVQAEYALREDKTPGVFIACPQSIGAALARSVAASMLQMKTVELAVEPAKAKPYYRQFEKRSRF